MPPSPGDAVVVLHGLGRTACSMGSLVRALRRDGFGVLNLGYPSVTAPVPRLAARLADRIERRTAAHPPERLHFVGHSLGTVLIRWILANRPPKHLGRVVFLAPPSRGSHVADRVVPWLGWLVRSLPDLTTAEGSAARSLALPPDVEVAVIAGSRDRTVALEETRLPRETARALVPSGHSFIMNKREVHALVARFLATGRLTDGS